jgi:hypothetical protein
MEVSGAGSGFSAGPTVGAAVGGLQAAQHLQRLVTLAGPQQADAHMQPRVVRVALHALGQALGHQRQALVGLAVALHRLP